MKKRILYLVIYLVGYCLCYGLIRSAIITSKVRLHKEPTYTVSDRTFNATMSLFSWAGVVSGVVMYCQDNIDGNAPANW